MKLIVKDLKKKFDKKEVLKGLNFEFGFLTVNS